MGVQITELLVGNSIKIEDLAGKIIAIDSFNHLYQFLTTIRQRDGTPLMDRHGNVTSHLSGLFSRTVNLLENNIRPVYVFDGKAPELKLKERERREGLKKKAEEKYKVAVEKEDVDEMKKYAGRTSRLTREMIEEAKQLVEALGLPVVQAPSEGEAQAAFLVAEGRAYAVASQDADSLLFGASKLIRNLSISGRRRRGATLTYEQIQPELIELNKTLEALKITREQLIVLSILVGTDYNQGGIKGIGPKNALKLLHEHGENFDKIFSEVKWTEHHSIDWKKILDLFLHLPVEKDCRLRWLEPDEGKLREILVEKHDFSSERILSSLQKLQLSKKKIMQKGLGEFL